ncbi:MAG: hypothetical protein WCI92_00445 [Bacteroidota bacterium]
MESFPNDRHVDFEPIIKRIRGYHQLQLSSHSCAFIKIKLKSDELEYLAVELSKVLYANLTIPIFSIDAEDPTVSFQSIKKTPVMTTDSTGRHGFVTKLLFPEDKPVILMINSFNQLKGIDQGGFARLEDEKHDNYKTLWEIFMGSIILAGIDESDNPIDPRASEMGIYLKPTFLSVNQ